MSTPPTKPTVPHERDMTPAEKSVYDQTAQALAEGRVSRTLGLQILAGLINPARAEASEPPPPPQLTPIAQAAQATLAAPAPIAAAPTIQTPATATPAKPHKPTALEIAIGDNPALKASFVIFTKKVAAAIATKNADLRLSAIKNFAADLSSHRIRNPYNLAVDAAEALDPTPQRGAQQIR